jgi:ATP-dependent RNA helicase DeaD
MMDFETRDSDQDVLSSQPASAASAVRFEDLGLSSDILEGVKAAGFTSPSPIQEAAIPAIMAGQDIIGQAQTGTGKTAAFGLPAMSRLKNNKTVEMLVLTPTRELAIQVSDELFKLGKFAGVKTVPVVGGQGYLRQVELINRGAQVVVATPGRLMDHMREGNLKKFSPHIVVLDEADEMLDRGFVDDIREILSALPAERQTLLFSATMPKEVKALTREFMKEPAHIQLNAVQQTNLDIEQRLIVVRGHERESALVRILEVEEPEKAMVFCRTKRDVDQLQELLTQRGVSAKSIHGDMSQAIRNQAVQSLKDGRAKIIIATDVAARGIDIPNVTHVINFSVPENRERYVHRIGRTGRAGKQGLAITLATPGDLRGGDVFTGKHADEFVMAEVPTRAHVRARLAQRLSLAVDGVRVREEWAVVASDLASRYSAEELAQRLVSILSDGRTINGEDRIGMNVEEGRRMLKNNDKGGGGGKFAFGGKRYGSQGGGYGGGYGRGGRSFGGAGKSRSFGDSRSSDSRSSDSRSSDSRSSDSRFGDKRASGGSYGSGKSGSSGGEKRYGDKPRFGSPKPRFDKNPEYAR